MVSPKTITSGDKSPSPVPFEEPEGMVTIDLNSDNVSKKSDDLKKDEGKQKNKLKMISKTILYLVLLCVVIFAVIVLISEDTYLFKRQPLKIITVTEKPTVMSTEDMNEIFSNIYAERSRNDLMNCLNSKTLEICCDKFSSEIPDLAEFCSVNDAINLIEFVLNPGRPKRSAQLSPPPEYYIGPYVNGPEPISEQGYIKCDDEGVNNDPQNYDPNQNPIRYEPEYQNQQNFLDNTINMNMNEDYHLNQYAQLENNNQNYETNENIPKEINYGPGFIIHVPKMPSIQNMMSNFPQYEVQPMSENSNLPIRYESSREANHVITQSSINFHEYYGDLHPSNAVASTPYSSGIPTQYLAITSNPHTTTKSLTYSTSTNRPSDSKQEQSEHTIEKNRLTNFTDSNTILNIPETPNKTLLNPENYRSSNVENLGDHSQSNDKTEKNKSFNTIHIETNSNEVKSDMSINVESNEANDTDQNHTILVPGNGAPYDVEVYKEILENSTKASDKSYDNLSIDENFTDVDQLSDTRTEIIDVDKIIDYIENSVNDLQNRAAEKDCTESPNTNELDKSLIESNTTSYSNNNVVSKSSRQDSVTDDASIGNSDTRRNEDMQAKSKTDFSSIAEVQSANQHAMYNPCFYPYSPYNPYMVPPRVAMTYQPQLLKIVPALPPKAPEYMLNPPMYPYMQPSLPMMGPMPIIPPQHYIPNYMQQPSSPIQVSGPGGQYYLCSPIQPPSNNIASMPGIEIRREGSNLQDMIDNFSYDQISSNVSREAPIVCADEQFACLDGSRCVSKQHICDNQAHCDDGTDEMMCTCRDRVGQMRTCDGYFDCPNGEDEMGCFGCAENEFSCDDWSRIRRSTCIPMEQRCDNIRQCEITGKDEEDCTILSDNVGVQPQYKISNTVGFLHRNYKGAWYPTCFGTEFWAMDVCKIEGGPSAFIPRSHMMVTSNNYNGQFINILPNKQIDLVETCVQDRAAFVECPPVYCGLRISVRNPYRPQEVDTSVEDLVNNLERVGIIHLDTNKNKTRDDILTNSRVVGGKPSQPAAWPWLVSIYKNGIFHCGGVLINEEWVVTAAHCVDRYWQYYYEIQSGMLRRFSYSPMEQNRWASMVISHADYDRVTLQNDIALMKLSSPVRFNRYVRPICLPSEATAGRDFLKGPPVGSICTTVGWGATIEHGADPDHMREVEVPVLSHCKHPDDSLDNEICAGLLEGGKDACQGDSGGPFMCRNPNNPSQWYLAGIVSHGEGCARPNEPGVYTKVSRYVGWIAENTKNAVFVPRIPLQRCPGYVCNATKKCLPKKHHCDKIVDCLFGDDEINCTPSFHDIFKHSSNSYYLQSQHLPNNDTTPYVTTETTMSNEHLNKPPHNSSSSDNVAENSASDMSIELKNSHLKRLERSTNVTEEYFKCKSMLQLTPIHRRCNKMVDCEDGTDEMGCLCVDYIKNYSPSAICDGITDCVDLSDEKNCTECDPKTEYHCRRSKKCIPLSKRCDRVADCSKSEDEWDCAALTDGATLILDTDLRPVLAMSGIITINRFGVWRPFCANVSTDVPSIAANICHLLGFEEYTSYDKYQVEDKPLDVTQNSSQAIEREANRTMEICSGLYVKCSNVSLDSPVHNVYLDNVTGDIELYTSPWNAMIYSDGVFRCMGTVLNSMWIVTSVNCFKGITMLETNYVTILLGKGKAHFKIKGPHEQIIRVIYAMNITNTDILLLQLENTIIFNRYVKSVSLNTRRDGHRKEKCVATGLENDKAKYVFMSPIKHCYTGYRCFESKLVDKCQNSIQWSGAIVCDSGNGWYPAAVYSEKRGHCGLSSISRYTSLKYYKIQIQEAMKQAPFKVDAPRCEGFRCALGECINKNRTCDGIPDCRGGEDEEPELCYRNEMLCHLEDRCVCPPNQMKCNNNKCIDKTLFCDRRNDCGEMEDEPDVCSCKAYLQITNSSKICDGVLNCADRSDEDPSLCPCKLDSFSCHSTNHCVPSDMVCDGYKDCPNGEDEVACMSLNMKDNERMNAGEVMTRTAGLWHPGCFHANYTTTQLEEICLKLGFAGGSATQLHPPKSVDTIITRRPVIDHFSVVWIRRNPGYKLKIGIRTGNVNYLNFVDDENCLRLFIACM